MAMANFLIGTVIPPTQEKFSKGFVGYRGKYSTCQPASVAQLDVSLIGDQKVVGLTPAGLATFFHGD